RRRRWNRRPGEMLVRPECRVAWRPSLMIKEQGEFQRSGFRSLGKRYCCPEMTFMGLRQRPSQPYLAARSWNARASRPRSNGTLPGTDRAGRHPRFLMATVLAQFALADCLPERAN